MPRPAVMRFTAPGRMSCRQPRLSRWKISPARGQVKVWSPVWGWGPTHRPSPRWVSRGPKWSRKHQAPIMRRARLGRARRMAMPSPRMASRVERSWVSGPPVAWGQSWESDGSQGFSRSLMAGPSVARVPRGWASAPYSAPEPWRGAKPVAEGPVAREASLRLPARPLQGAESGMGHGLPRLLGADAVGPHHLIVLVLDDVAVPGELAGIREAPADAGDLAGVGDHRVLETGFPGFRWLGVRRRQPDLARPFVDEDVLAIDDLEGDLVHVDRMGVAGRIVELPELGGADSGVFGHRVRPRKPSRKSGKDFAKHGFHRAFDQLSLGVVPRARFFNERERSRDSFLGQRCDGRENQELRGRCGVGPKGRDDAELQDLSGGGWIGFVEVVGRFATAERLVGADVAQDVATDGHVGKVDNDIGALGGGHEQPVCVKGSEVRRRRQEAAFVADGPDFHAGNAAEIQDQEARLAAVQEAEAVAPLLHRLEGPGVAVGDEAVAEELRIPDR